VSAALAQAPLRTSRVWNVAWRDVIDSEGRTTRVPVLAWGEPLPPSPGTRYTAPKEVEPVVWLEDRLHQARATQSAVALEAILSEQFLETDADGTSRDKAATIAALKDTPPNARVANGFHVRVADNAVLVSGQETDGTGEGSHRKTFTHVYVRDAGGAWKLVSSTIVRLAR
jgi:hypothetical protein